DRDAARARAQIEGAAQHAAAASPLERHLDQSLAVGPRNQDTCVDAQRNAVELALTEQVRDRLAGAAPFEQLAKGAELGRREWSLRSQDQADAVEPQHTSEQQLDIEPRSVVAAALQVVGSPSQNAPNGPNLLADVAGRAFAVVLAGRHCAHATPTLCLTS